MFKKIVSLFLVIGIIFCTTSCSGKKQYVYRCVGSIFSNYVCVFDKPLTSKEGGNYKWLLRENWEKTEDFDAVSFDECSEYGTFEWQSKDEILTLTPSDENRLKDDYYVINDILVDTYCYDSAEEVKRVGDYIVGTVADPVDVYITTTYNADGSYISYSVSEDNTGNYSTGDYYIDGNLIYGKYSDDNEYTVDALIFDDKVVYLSLSWAYVLEK